MIEPSLVFYCIECDMRIDICSCEAFRDRGCWDCGPSCQVNHRREALQALQEALAEETEVPMSRPSHLIIPEQDREYLQHIIHKRWWKEREQTRERQKQRAKERSLPTRAILRLLRAA